MKEKKYRRCPRCNARQNINEERCTNCRLVFSRLKFATNKAGIASLKNGEQNKVVYLSPLPSDVSKWKLFFLALFFGFTGVQYQKVGRTKSFVYMLVSLALLIVYGGCIYFSLIPSEIFYHQYWGIVFDIMTLPSGISAILWLVSIWQILTNKFKVPVSLDEEYVFDSVDKSVADAILKDLNKDKNKNKLQNENSYKKLKKNKRGQTLVCASCGRVVKIKQNSKLCPKCGEPFEEEKNEK